MTQALFLLSLRMFVRKKKNRSGTVTIVVVDKSHGRFREVHNLGTSSDAHEIEKLEMEARKWICKYVGQPALDLWPEERLLSQSEIISSIRDLRQDGAVQLLGQVYRSIGFESLGDDILRDLAIARVCEPRSKLATVEYMRRYWGGDYHYQQVYRYLDTLYNSRKEEVLKISVEHTRKILGGVITVAFYDVTTLYFESFKEDNLRAPGFSKDGKTAETQVVLGLLVSENGYPLSYSLFNGAQFEGRTMIPLVDDFIQRYDIKDFVLVADSGLMSKKNIELLRKAGYKYIIGARIKNEVQSLCTWITGLPKHDNQIYEHRKTNGDRLIVSYTDKRADKDKFNRDRGVTRLQQAYKSGRISKDKINKRGYNKFLVISKDIEVSIDMEKVTEDSKWDGWKGYITNTNINSKDIISQYNGLWVVERSFRISKGTLEMRPMFHFTERRIEAHVCLCFVALKVYKEFERLLRMIEFEMSVDKVLDIAKTLSTITIALPNGETVVKTLFLTPDQKLIEPVFAALGV